MAEINHAIGATGIVSGECKMVVQQYGDLIIQLLISKVCTFKIYAFMLVYQSVKAGTYHKRFIDLHPRP